MQYSVLLCLCIQWDGSTYNINWNEISEFPKMYSLAMYTTIFAYIILIILCYWLVWTENDFNDFIVVVGFTSFIIYLITNIAIIILNMYLIVCFWREVGEMFPELYKKIRIKLNTYFLFIISLLIVRLVVSIPIFIEYYDSIEIIIPVVQNIHPLHFWDSPSNPTNVLVYNFWE